MYVEAYRLWSAPIVNGGKGVKICPTLVETIPRRGGQGFPSRTSRTREYIDTGGEVSSSVMGSSLSPAVPSSGLETHPSVL